MSLTFMEILDEMKTAFCREKGEAVKNLSDLEARFKAVAAEIYSVCVYGDFIIRQSFPQTASGTYLDRHAQLRKISRKEPSYAEGRIILSRTENSTGTVLSVPKGTVFSVSDRPFIQFATTAAGGCDAESDEALRERILNSYSSRKNAVSAAAVRESLLTIDGVTDAVVSAGENHVLKVCLKTDSGIISSTLKNQVTDMLGFAVLCGAKLEFTAAAEQPFGVTAEVKILSGYNPSEIQKTVERKISEFCSSEKIGQNYSESAIAAYCSGIDGVEYINIFLGTESTGAAACGSTGFLKLQKTEVYTYE